MQILIDTYKNSGKLHHAYFLVGDTGLIIPSIKNFLQKTLEINTSGSADFWQGKFHNLTVDEVKSIVSMSENKDFSSGKKVFIIETDFITEEAQNTMLKVFEEPTDGTHFFVVSPQDMLLPTLRSRMVVFRQENEGGVNTKILDLNIKDRLDLIKKITEAIKDEESTKQQAIELLNNIESELYQNGIQENQHALELCQKTRESLYDRGAPIKIVLENLVLNI